MSFVNETFKLLSRVCPTLIFFYQTAKETCTARNMGQCLKCCWLRSLWTVNFGNILFWKKKKMIMICLSDNIFKQSFSALNIILYFRCGWLICFHSRYIRSQSNVLFYFYIQGVISTNLKHALESFKPVLNSYLMNCEQISAVNCLYI